MKLSEDECAKRRENYYKNKDSILLSRRLYYIKNKEKILKRVKGYYKLNKDKILKREKDRYIKNSEIIKSKVMDYYWKNESTIKIKNKEYRIKNKVALSKKQKEWCIKNKEYLVKSGKEYREKNKAKIAKRIRKWESEKYKSDPVFKLMRLARSRARGFLKSIGIRKTKSYNSIFGADAIFVRSHIERMFIGEMSWKNHGKVWHIDHIIPLSTAKTEDEVLRLCHYTNLQPLFVHENLQKGARLDWPPKESSK